MAISQESLLGMLIPDVYIDGITLESSGTPAIEDNPHILHEREAASVAAFNEAMDNRTMRVTVDLCLKERLDNSLIGSWFQEQEFHKYLKLYVVMTTHQGAIKLFSHSQNMINFASEGTIVIGGEDNRDLNTFSQDEIDLLIKHIGPPEEVDALFDSGRIQQAILSVSADVVGDNSNLTQISSSVDENGTSIHDFTYRSVFELKELEPADLGIFAVSYLDLAAMKADFDLEFNVGTLEQQNGKVVSEIAIKKGSLVSKSNIWLTPDGEYWTGPVHKTGLNSWATGSEPSSASVKLTKRTVPNDILQDFRDIAEIMKYSLDADIQEAMTAVEKNKFCKKDRPFMDHKYLYFSDLWLSRDTNGTARYMFAFDKKSFLQKNSSYGWLLERLSDSTRNMILNEASVRNMTLLRRRVKSVKARNKLGSPYEGEILFDKDEPYVSIAMTANGVDNKLVERDAPAGSLRESNLLISPLNDDSGIQYYTGQDKTMSQITDGHYQYGVRIEMEDGIQEFLRAFTDELLRERNHLDLYLEHSMKLGMTKILQEVNDPHIDHEGERVASITESAGHYDPLRNRFTNRFVQFMDEQRELSTSPFYQKRPWIDAAVIYSTGLLVISQQAESAVFNDNYNIFEKISMFMAPNSGTPQGLMAVMNLYDGLISKYQRLTGDDYRSRGRASMSPHPSNPSASSITSGENVPGVILKCENWFFNDILDSKLGKSTGFDYLTDIFSSALSNTNKPSQQIMRLHEYADIVFGNEQARGLKLIDGGYWEQRIRTETTQYYSDTNISTQLAYNNYTVSLGGTLSDSSFGFITPSFAVADKRAYCVTTGKDADYYLKIESAILSSKNNQFFELKDTTSKNRQSSAQQVYQSSMSSIWSKLNLTLQPSTATPAIPLYQSQRAVREEPTQCDLQQLQAIDPFPSWNVDADGNTVVLSGNSKKEEEQGTKNSNYADFYAKLSSTIITSEQKAGSMTISLPTVKPTIALNITQPQNKFTQMATDATIISSVAKSNGFSGTATMASAYNSLPNQIKSVALKYVKPSVVQPSSTTTTWISEPEFRINYDFIAMVERFDGFSKNMPMPSYDGGSSAVQVSNLPSVRKPRWVTLDENFFRQAQGEEILCRLSKYSCEALGITAPEGMDVPIYDRYFILTPFTRSPANAVNDNRTIMTNSLETRYRKTDYSHRQVGTTNVIAY